MKNDVRKRKKNNKRFQDLVLEQFLRQVKILKEQKKILKKMFGKEYERAIEKEDQFKILEDVRLYRMLEKEELKKILGEEVER